MPVYIAASLENGAIQLSVTYDVVGSHLEPDDDGGQVNVEDTLAVAAVVVVGARNQLPSGKAHVPVEGQVGGIVVDKDNAMVHAGLVHPEIRLHG